MDKNQLTEEIFKMGERILDYAEISITNHDIYLKYRSRVLRQINNLVRRIDKEYKDNA